ncbi:MAG: protein kinase, partial [Planctomycetota bacterium]|nr:protein kinase [Planctomycetota bacterium]
MALNQTDKQLALFVLQNNMLDAQSVRQLGFLAEQRQTSFYQVLLESQQLTQKQLIDLQAQLPNAVAESQHGGSKAELLQSPENFKPTAKLQSSLLKEALIKTPASPPPIHSSTNHFTPPSTSLGSVEVSRSQERTSMSVGSVLGPYKLLSELGKGGMGIVYKAHHTALDKICAIKVLIAGQDAPSEVLQRFITEAKLAAKLEAHPNIVRVLDSGVLENRYFMSMELIEGCSLAEL